ncbi:MAG TPA: NUDIX hydrolase [Kiritimatiellia bacterium]|nr:NUDIX hydrolase [Kiritimatiellia bacterium]
MNKPPHAPWTCRATRLILDHSPFLKVEEHHVVLPDGREVPDWPILITPDYVNVLARTHDNHFLLFRQTKYAVADQLLSPPGGYLEPGENPLEGAKRELREETGYTQGQWHHLGSYIVDANRRCATAHLYLATGLRKTHDLHPDDLEHQQLCLLTRPELEAALDENHCRVLAWASLLALGLRKLDHLPTS